MQQKISFIDLPDEIGSMIYLIKDKHLHELYSKFSFFYFPCQAIQENLFDSYNYDEIQNLIKDFLLVYLQKFHFLTYYLDQNYLFSKLIKSTDITNHDNNIINVIICVEKQCLIIEQINFDFFERIINELKKKENILVLNVNRSNLKYDATNDEMQASEEINNFCKYFTKSLIKNGFVQSTIIPIAGYIIRRFYCPTEYFKDRSFFIFNHSNIFKKLNIYEKISDIFFTEQPTVNQATQIIVEIMQYGENSTCIVKKEFSKNDFIHLRKIHANSKAIFMLAIHRKSFYLLVIKYVFVSMENSKNVDHEINFCESYKNRCLVPFYGFVKSDGKIIGFVYEFMANGSLDSYLSKKIQYKDIFIMMAINRLCQGIFYLHSNFLVHRDLKPSNILVNNDLLPFISDFETIRKPIDEVDFLNGETMSNDLETPLYSSPEQDFGEYVSYPSDIYSFGLIIYYMYEMRDMWSHEILSKSSKKFLRAKPMTNGSINIKKIYEDCVKLSLKERPTIIEIIGKLIDDFYNAQDKPIHARYYYEIARENGNPEAYFHLGDLYKKGLGVEQNYKKAKDYYEISASYNNPNAYFELGELYKNGFGVKINYLYAKNYYKKSSELGNPAAYFNLAEFYSNGDINDVNYGKSIQYYMKCIEIPNDYIKIYDKEQKSYSFSYMYNTYTYHSYNNIGLIYMTVFDDIEKAEKYIKEAAFAEYPYAQNNFGLFLQFYMNKLDDAKYMYERSSKHNFAIAEYNLGHFYEEKGDVKKSIEYYCKASEDESEPLIFRNKQHFDKRLEISKIFVVCFTNLKLVNIFFSLSNIEKAKKYFIKSFDILIKNDSNYRFYFILNKTKGDNIFTYLKEFILNFPLFNLTIFKDTKSTKNIILDIARNQFNEKYLLIKKQKNVQKDNEFSNINEQNYFIEIDDDIVFESASDLFDYIIQNNDLEKVFIKEIIDIINVMNLILYTKPFSILFGRIDIMKNKKSKRNLMYDINHMFYEGFNLC